MWAYSLRACCAQSILRLWSSMAACARCAAAPPTPLLHACSRTADSGHTLAGRRGLGATARTARRAHNGALSRSSRWRLALPAHGRLLLAHAQRRRLSTRRRRRPRLLPLPHLSLRRGRTGPRPPPPLEPHAVRRRALLRRRAGGLPLPAQPRSIPYQAGLPVRRAAVAGWAPPLVGCVGDVRAPAHAALR